MEERFSMLNDGTWMEDISLESGDTDRLTTACNPVLGSEQAPHNYTATHAPPFPLAFSAFSGGFAEEYLF